MIFDGEVPKHSALRAAIGAARRQDETATVAAILQEAALPTSARKRIAARARGLVADVRRRAQGHGGVDTFLVEFGLSDREGIVLMCLAEALLRIPDAATADRLIRDKIAGADWRAHLGRSDSLFVNASTWALMLTGRVLRLEDDTDGDVASVLGRLVAKGGEPVIREALSGAMRILGRQFVMGRSIEEALERARPAEARGTRHSFDMLGEAAMTAHDADRYYARYDAAISAIGAAAEDGPDEARPGISVKLSALHPRYEAAQGGRVLRELPPRLTALAAHAREVGIGLTVDAEEGERLELSLGVLDIVSADKRLAGWSGLGVAVQAYDRRAGAVIDWLADIARRDGRRLGARLVKGAYWDSEIKRAQEGGFESYPVFTRKASTDVAYVACARRLLAAPDAFYPQFATHNAHTLATIVELTKDFDAFECQRLHGMGEALYEGLVGDGGLACRVYGPVGSHEELLPYLVRRLLENGANTSFVHRIVDERVPIADLIADPIAKVERLETKPHPRIPLPVNLYGEARRNSGGVDFADGAELRALAEALDQADTGGWHSAPIIGGDEATDGKPRDLRNPADRRRVVGRVAEALPKHVDDAVERATAAATDWDRLGAEARARCLEKAAELIEAERASLMVVCVREAGRTVPDGLAEVREAADFCRYYAARARADFASPRVLAGPTGERNEMRLNGRGVFACISPWNFPLAIFVGQVSAALAAGNTVLAKPAEQTPLMAALATRLLHQAGVPGDALHLLPGGGEDVGARLVADARVAGVAFTGSTETARRINRVLAARDGPIAPLIAETGGQNALIADSSCLPEQTVADVVTSSFNSAGQRCSALRVLFVQQDIAERLIDMLKGAMAELVIGDPAVLSTDVGPVIDDAAKKTLEAHAAKITRDGSVIFRAELPESCAHGSYVAPLAVEIDGIGLLEREVFGPILHVVRYAEDRLDEVIEAINGTGYGLTVGIHSRIDTRVDDIGRRLKVGNAYVNRNMVGAVVGVQPFGGEGLSGTGPKAGGPRTLHRFATERSLAVNTAATGGDTSLMALEEEAE